MEEIEQKLKSSHYSFLVKNVFWLQLSRILTSALSLLALPIITAFLAPEAFGIIALFMVESSLLSCFYSLGLTAFAGRMIYKYERRNKKACRQYLGITLFYLVIFSFLGVILSLPLSRLIKESIFKDIFFPHPFLFYIPVVQAFFLSIFGFTSGAFSNLQENKKVFICDILAFLLLIPAQVIGLVWFGFTWVEVVVLQLIAQIIVTFVSLWLIRGNLGFSFRRLGVIKYALRYSIAYLPMSLSAWIKQQIDKIFLGRMHAISYVGVYAAGLKISEGYQFFSRPIASSLKPEISKRLDMRKENVNTDISDFFTLFFQFSLFLVFALSVFSREIIDILTDVKYLSAFNIVPLAMLGYMVSEVSGVFYLKIIYKNKTIFFTLITFLGAFLNVLLNYTLVPRYGMVGAASATALTNLIICFVAYVISQKLHFTRYYMVKNFLLFALVVILIFLIKYLLPYSNLAIFIKFGIIAIYGGSLYSYFLHTSKRFKELKDTLIMTVKARLKRGF